jgi:hypothetical protein
MARNPKHLAKVAEPIPAAKLKKWNRRPSANYDLMPGSNRYGVTDLRLDLQAEYLPEPVVKWGALYRGATITGGAHHFYTDDYKFSGLWGRPSTIGSSLCYCTVEPNFSIGPQTPRWQAIEKIAMKRWLARYWQEEYGIRIIVDLNVHPDAYDIALLGVPKGWKSYATRVHRDEDVSWDDIEDQYDLAVDRAGHDAIFFAVFGGGLQTRAKCRANGWVWHRCSRNWRDISETFIPPEHERIIHRMPPQTAKELLPAILQPGSRGRQLKAMRDGRDLEDPEPDTEPGEAPGDES